MPISGAKLTLTTSGRGRQRSDGTVDNTKRIRYACYGKTRKQTDFDGQTGYTMHILDDLIDEIVRGIFTKMRGVSKDDMIRLRYANELEIRKARLIVLNADYTKAVDNLQVLKDEVVNAIKGESSFSPEMLSGLIAEAEKECTRLAALCAQAEKDVTDSEQLLKEVAASFDTLVSWAELYDTASFEKKKMIVHIGAPSGMICLNHPLPFGKRRRKPKSPAPPKKGRRGNMSENYPRLKLNSFVKKSMIF